MVIKMLGKIIGATKYSMGNNIEVPMRMILSESENGFASHFQRKDDGMKFSGDYYHCPLEEAKELFVKRVENHNLTYGEGNPSHVGNEIEWD